MSRVMTRRRLVSFAALVALAVVLAVGWGLRRNAALEAQETTTALARKFFMTWYGPIGMTREQTLQGNFFNAGTGPIVFQWFVSDAESGEILSRNEPMLIAPRMGGSWKYNMAPTELEARCNVVIWYRVSHSKMDDVPVDLGTVEVFDNDTMKTAVYAAANWSAMSMQ